MMIVKPQLPTSECTRSSSQNRGFASTLNHLP